MTATHRTKPTDVVAWKFELGAPVPVWVACKAIGLSDGRLNVNTPTGVCTAGLGDWIVCKPDDLNDVYPITAAQFRAIFEPVEIGRDAPSDGLEDGKAAMSEVPASAEH